MCWWHWFSDSCGVMTPSCCCRTVIANMGFAFPRLVWATYISYSLIALLLTQVMVGSSNTPN